MVARPQTDEFGLPCRSLKWTTISSAQVAQGDCRFDAYAPVESAIAHETLNRCRWPVAPLHPTQISTPRHFPRFKRVYLAEKDNGEPFFLPSQIGDIQLKPVKWISRFTETDINALRVKKNQILIACSGTIGDCTFVREAFAGRCFSHDLIRAEAREYPGYVYAFLKTQLARALLRTQNYGAVIQHIEPAHLAALLAPDPPRRIKAAIHRRIESARKLLDESNSLFDDAREDLRRALKLPPVDALEKAESHRFLTDAKAAMFAVRIGASGRLDASHHYPLAAAIVARLHKTAAEVTTVADSRISKRVILPGRFARVYVDEDHGATFFGGKQIGQLDPCEEKHLSLKYHGERIKTELLLKENFILITRSGTVGRVVITPSHWKKRVASDHIIRVIPADDNIAGYLFAWLAGDYARPLITRQIYGAVVDEIDADHVRQIPVPLLKDQAAQSDINHKILLMNQKRTQAYNLEKAAIAAVEEKVIHAEK